MAWILQDAALTELVSERHRGTHPPRIGHELCQALGGYLSQPQHDKRLAIVSGGGEEQPWLTKEKRLLPGLITDVQHGDVGPDDPRPSESTPWVRPDEPLTRHPAVEAVTVDLLDLRQPEREAAHVVSISAPVHRSG
jgi:hypothetical protein